MPLSMASYTRPTTKASGYAARMPATMPAPGCGFSPRLSPVMAIRMRLPPGQFGCASEETFEVATGRVLVDFVFAQQLLQQRLFVLLALLHPSHKAQGGGRELVAQSFHGIKSEAAVIQKEVVEFGVHGGRGVGEFADLTMAQCEPV